MTALLKEIKRLRLQTLARAFTERNDLAVRLGKTSATDLSNIEIQHCDGKIVPGVPASPAECWVALKAMDAHESGHILFTAAGAMEEAGRKGGPLLQHILNVLEDARIERAMANAYPGTLSWFRFTNEYIYRNRQDWGEGTQAFLWGLCAHAMVGRVPDALDQETRDLIEECKPLVDEARLAGSTREVLQRAEKIYALVKDAFPAPSLPPVTMTGTDSPRETPQGPLDPRKAPVKRVSKRQENNSSDSPEEPQENGEKSGSQTSGDAGNRENADSDNSGNFGEDFENEPETPEEDGDGSSKEDCGSGGEEDPGEEADSEGDDSGEDDDSSEGDGGGSGEADADESSSDGETGDGGSPAGGDALPDDDNGEDSGAGEDGSGDRESDDEKDDGYNQGPGDWNGDEEDDRDPGGLEESAGQGPDPQPSGDEEGDWDEGEASGPERSGDRVPEDGGPGDPAEPGDEDEEDPGGDFSSLLEEAENELSRMKNDAERREKEAARSAAPEPDWSKIREEVSKDLHQGCLIHVDNLRPNPSLYRGLVGSQGGLIRRLVEEIRKALEYRPAVPRRNLKKGRLDAESLWKLGVSDPQVFSRREVPGDVPELAVYLLVDCSGSMGNPQYTSRGYSAKLKIEMAREAACALHEACAQLKIAHCVVGFASDFPYTDLYRAVGWKERDGAAIASLTDHYACNRDGYVIRAVARELEVRPEPRKVLIVLSDGLPNDEHDKRYQIRFTAVPVQDTARAVRELERKGIGVVGIFFGNENNLSQAQTIYNRLVYVQDVGNLPVVLGRVLKQVITQGA